MDPGWFVEPIIEKIINIGFQYLKGQIRWQTGMKKDLQKLQNIYPKVKAVVFASREAQSREQNSGLNQWLWQLRDAIDDADDVLDEFEYLNHKRQETKSKKQGNVRMIMKSIKKRVVKFVKRALQIDPNLKRLEEALKKLGEVSADVGNFLYLLETTKQEQKEQLQEFFQTRETGSLPTIDLIGRVKDKEYVMQWLKKPSNEDQTTRYSKISLLSVVGHGGMGKTTLLQHVYDEMTKEFYPKIWVCVSNNFDPKKVIAAMLECCKSMGPHAESLGALQESLKSEVMNKKFLLVLDDIWEEDGEKDKRKWEKVFAPLAYGGLGSKILITTRMYSVASMIAKLLIKKEEDTILRLEGLEEDQCLQLLNSYAFVNVEHSDDHKHLRSISVQIVKKLSGSPLAAKVIGSVLNSSLDMRHWQNILNSDIMSAQSDQNDIFSILRLSYTFLPKHLQNCFAFCCIFPQDHEFDKDDLVRMWIALGFIQSSANQEETVEDIGGRYFDVLVKKSFFDEFQRFSRTHYKMHDLLHELAQSVSTHECFRVVMDKEMHSRIPETIRHLSIETENLERLKQIETFKRLRSLFINIKVHNEEIVDALTKIFQSLRSIRLLCIFFDDLRLIPKAFGNLVHLRYLKIIGEVTTPLPSSLTNLYHLRFIVFVGFYAKINDVLPRDMNNLFNLRYLNLPWDRVDGMHEIGKLRFLQKLNGFSVKNEDGYSIQELEHMNELRLLRIKLLENVKDAEQACKAKLCDKRNLTDLSLEWGDVSIWNNGEPREYNEGEILRNIVNFDLDERVSDNLRPHSSLKKLRIHSFMGVRSPFWLNNANLMSNLEYIQLNNCLEWQTLPPFGKLPFLKSMYLFNMPKAKSIDFRYETKEKDCVFPSLEVLAIEKLEALEDWFDATITDDRFFPCLTKLHLQDCPNLKELPCLPPKLESLGINNIGWKTLSCRSISKSIPLEELVVINCPNITCISLADNITRFSALRDLDIVKCPNLISLGGHQEVETTENCQLTLNNLEIINPSLLLMEPLRSIASLQKLNIRNNDELVSFPMEVEQWFLHVSSSLLKLLFENLKSLRSLPSSLESLSSLVDLQIENSPELQFLPNLPASLKRLWIKNVPLLQQLPDLSPSLVFLTIFGGNEELKKRYDKISGFDRDKVAHIPFVEIY